MIIVSVISFFGFKLLTQFILGNGSAKDIPAPTLMGKTIEEAQQMLKDKKIKVVEAEARFDSSYKAGTIISQDPEPNIGVKAPGEIKVIVSKGGKAIGVPNIVGKEEREAKYMLQNLNLGYKIYNESNESIPQGYIIRQYPEADSQVSENTEVEVYVSDGIDPNKIIMPNLMGIFENQAKKTLQEKKISFGKITYDYDKSQPEGVVLKQSVDKDTLIDAKQKIDLVVNKNTSKQNPNPEVTKAAQKTQMIYLNLSDKGQRDTFTVRVETEGKMGKQIIYEKVHSRDDGQIGIPVSGNGDMLIRVFIDGVLDSEQAVTF
jgi:serine/threonine-protein kinase